MGKMSADMIESRRSDEELVDEVPPLKSGKVEFVVVALPDTSISKEP